MNVKVTVLLEDGERRVRVDLETGQMEARYGHPHPIVGALNAVFDGSRKVIVETLKEASS